MTTLDPAKKSASITLSNGNLTASTTTNARLSALGTTLKDLSVARAFELTVDAYSTGSFCIGFAVSTYSSFSNYPGRGGSDGCSLAFGPWGWELNYGGITNPTFYSGISGFAVGSVIRVEITTGGLVTFKHNGVTLTTKQTTLTDIYPAVGMGSSSGSAWTATADFTDWDVASGTDHVGAAALSGIGTATAAASAVRKGAATVSGSGSLVLVAAIIRGGVSALSGTGSLTATARRETHGAASLTGAGTLTATAARALLASTALSGAGDLTASAHASRAGAATFAGTGTLTASGSLGGTLTAAAALSGTGTFTASATITRGGSVSLAGSGSISAAYSVNLGAGAVMVGEGALVALSRLEAHSGAVLSAVGTMTAFGRSEAPRVATVSRPSFGYSSRRPVMAQSTRPRAVSMGRR